MTDLIDLAIAGDASAVRRLAIRKVPGVAAALAKIILATRSNLVVNVAGSKLSSRKTDPAAIAAMKRVLVGSRSRDAGIEMVAIGLAERKEPAAVTAAITAYPRIANGRARHFLVQTLCNRSDRDKTLRARDDLAMLLVDVAQTREEARADAVWALIKFKNPRTRRGLTKLLASRDRYQRETAAAALAAISVTFRSAGHSHSL